MTLFKTCSVILRAGPRRETLPQGQLPPLRLGAKHRLRDEDTEQEQRGVGKVLGKVCLLNKSLRLSKKKKVELFSSNLDGGGEGEKSLDNCLKSGGQR